MSAELHLTARCETERIGAGCTIGPFVFVAPTAEIGDGVCIDTHASVAEGARIGRNVHVGAGVHLPAGIVVEEEVKIGICAAFSDTRIVGTKASGDAPPVLRRGCRIGANATVFPGVTIGEVAVVDAGSVVRQSVSPHAIVAGDPARVIGFGDTQEAVESSRQGAGQVSPQSLRVEGVSVHELPFISDPRGNLTVGEMERSVPFAVQRYFLTYDVPGAHVRGEHAHKRCHQFLTCVHGSCAVVVDDGTSREELVLDRATLGLHVPPMVWASEYKHSPDSVLLVLASEYYDPEDYIRDYDEFLRCRKGR